MTRQGREIQIPLEEYSDGISVEETRLSGKRGTEYQDILSVGNTDRERYRTRIKQMML
jgi:hypothetical protein